MEVAPEGNIRTFCKLLPRKASNHLPMVSVIIPLYNGKEHILRLLESIRTSDYPNLEVIVIDDASTDGSLERVMTSFPTVRTLQNGTNRGKSWSINRGIDAAVGDFLVITDPDLVFDGGLIRVWVRALLKDSRIGVAGCFVYYGEARHKISRAGAKFNKRTGSNSHPLVNEHLAYDQENYEESQDWIFDDLYILRKSAVDRVGHYDFLNFPTIYEEADYQFRLSSAGYAKAIIPGARAFHTFPVMKWDQLRRYSQYKIELLCRNRFILLRKFRLLSLPKASAIALRLFIFYSVVVAVQPLSAKKRVALLSSVVRGISHGLSDPIAGPASNRSAMSNQTPTH